MSAESFAQQGAKWATGGNSISNVDFLGTTNNFPLLFKVNSTQKMSLSTTGVLQLNSLSGTGIGFAWFDANGNLSRTNFPNDTNKVLTGNGTFASFSSAGGWAHSGNNIYNSNSGFVGIGTNNPQALLHVNGNAIVNGTLFSTAIAGVQSFRADTILGAVEMMVANILCMEGGALAGVCTKTGDLTLQSHIGSNGNTIMNAGTFGNVGIGNFSPQYKLDVNGDARFSGSIRTQRIRPLPGDTAVIIGDSSIWISTSNRIFPYGPSTIYKGIAIGNLNSTARGLNSLAFGTGVWTTSTANYAVVLGSGAPTASLKNDIANSLMIGFNSNIPTLFVGPASGAGTYGNVGIRTTNPQADFQVGNNVQKVTMGSSYGIVGSNGNTFSNAYIGFNVARTSPGQWGTENDGGGNGGVVLLGDMGGGFRISGIPTTGPSNQTLSDQFIADHTKFYVRNDGRVIIGSETMVNGPHDQPSTLLTVDGTAICRELFVTQNNWADSIFSPDYNLMPLTSLQNYLDSAGHLPGVPSATEVQKDGNNVGQTEIILLAKIEELTLYMLQLQKQNAEMQKELDEMKVR